MQIVLSHRHVQYGTITRPTVFGDHHAKRIFAGCRLKLGFVGLSRGANTFFIGVVHEG